LSLDEAKNAGNTVVLARLFNEVQAKKMPSRMVRLILSEYLYATARVFLNYPPEYLTHHTKTIAQLPFQKNENELFRVQTIIFYLSEVFIRV
jgi:hypothetical protein